MDKFGWLPGSTAGLLVLLILGVSLGGCGKKGDPVAYDRSPTDMVLTTKKNPDRISLQWTSKMAMRTWSLFKLERSTFDPSRDECPACPRPFMTLAEVAPEQVCSEDGTVKCSYDDVRIVPGQRYRYRLKLYDRKNRCEIVTDSSEILY